MKISEAISKLQDIASAHGDLEIVVYEDNQSGDCAATVGDISEYDGTAGVHLKDAEIVPLA